MEYLALMGQDLRASLSPTLGQHAAFFWSVVAPIGLALIWVGCVFALWETWFRNGDAKETGSTITFRLFFTVMMSFVVLASGSALEYLLLGGGLVHARVLGGVVDLFRPH